jgi:hypothetical protein
MGYMGLYNLIIIGMTIYRLDQIGHNSNTCDTYCLIILYVPAKLFMHFAGNGKGKQQK